MLASTSSDGGGFLFAVAVFVCGGLAFFGGMSNKYVKKQEDLGRENVSLIQDIREGRPEIKQEKEEEAE